MFLELLVRVMVIALHRGFLELPVDPLRLTVRLGTIHLCEAMFNLVLPTYFVKNIGGGVSPIPPAVGKPDAVVRQDRVNRVRNNRNQVAHKRRGHRC